MYTHTLRKSLYAALLVAPLLFTACNKGSDNTTNTPVTPASEFVINGIHDVTIGTVGSNILGLAVAQSTGTQQPVTLSVTGLPTGVTADIQPANGTPAFASTITFNLNGSVTAGTYPIHIVGTSASYTKSYDLNITVPAINGFTLSGMLYNASNVAHYTSNTGGAPVSNFRVNSDDNGGGIVTGSLFKAWPTADGTYTYPLGGTSSNALYVYVSTGSTYYSESDPSDSTKMATVVISGGKFSIRIPEISMASTSSSSVTKKLIVDVKE